MTIDPQQVVAHAFEGHGEAWYDDTSGDRLAQVAVDALESAGLLRRVAVRVNEQSDKPVVAVDIDGTLCDYHGWFLKFAELYLGKPMPDPNRNTDGVPLYRWMGVSKATYRDVKLAYRQGGMKRSMPVYDAAADLCRSIRKAGAELWICTTRPYLRLDNIDPDTRHWLRRNRIQYDAVIYGERKYHDLAGIVGAERVVAVLDDLPELLTQASNVGIPLPILRSQPYNLNAEGFTRVEDLGKASRVIVDALTRRRGTS